MAGRDPVELWINFVRFVTAVVMTGGLIGAFVVFGDALLGKSKFETKGGWICLMVVAFAYVFRRAYPPVCRHIWASFK